MAIGGGGDTCTAYISALSRLAVARSGFEPLISALRGLHPRPLDERAGESPF